MERKTQIDAAGALSLIGFASLLAFSQIVVKISNDGFQPVFMAGLRSAGAVVVTLIWMWARGHKIEAPRDTWASGVLLGGLFGFEFLCLFWALDHTEVGRASILYYSMPVAMAISAHFLLGERLNLARSFGLLLAVLGVVLVLSDRQGGQVSLMGDLAAVAAALGWTALALTVRLTKMKDVSIEMQLLWQLAVSAVMLLVAAPFFGPLLREPTGLHVIGLLFQTIAVASLGFLVWFALMKRYPASSVASFSFLSPVLSVLMGWAMLGEKVGPVAIGALVLVAAGIIMINRPRRGRTHPV